MSNIVTTTIDETYPIAGQDNPSQGFRDNFQAIKTGLTVAKVEITNLQDTAIIAGQTNDLSNTIIGNATIRNSNTTFYEVDNTTGGFIIYDCAVGSNQLFTVTESVFVFEITNVPTLTNREQTFKISFVINNIDHVITIGEQFSNLDDLPLDAQRALSFDQTGTYEFEFSTTDSGTSYTIRDLTRGKTRFHNGINLYGDGSRIGRFYKDFNYNKGFFTSTLECDKIIANTFVNLEESALSVSGDLDIYGNITGDWIIANTAIIGTIGTASATQSNITALGTLTSLEVSGNSSLGTNGSSTVNTLFGKTDVCGVFMTQVSTQSGTNFNVANTDNTIICSGSGTITPNLPNTGMSDGQRFSFAFQNSVTVNFQSTEGATVTGLTGVSATSANGITLVYHSSRYYRI